MKLTAKNLWKLTNRLEESFTFEKLDGTEWVLTKSSMPEGKESFDRFLRSRPIDGDQTVLVLRGFRDVEEMKWSDFLLSYDKIFDGDENVRIVDSAYEWMFVCSHIGVVKFGHTKNEVPKNIT